MSLAEHHEIELHAYALWEQRGYPLGTPEIDWFRAEREIRNTQAPHANRIEAVARAIGSALGTVTSLVSSHNG